ncbi:aminoglycoside phosphotransferase family protein [Actinocorallia sp. A-T 12471]|uniref:phosphotransferase family protein n=1 Tax=Actinocorallia sp. A-T 12471 TaxID=3089813 RepID=UPI0029CDDDFC|nr:aminoglycoside phosphotransferase family protein [Actinocorallia sp. A-T 12471]MDX6739732.1 aminoglycoside phosphotransferase family protein [Actinocorallia sp. A-T 12471]
MIEHLTALAREAGGTGDAAVLYAHDDVLVVRVGDVVAKAHRRETTDLPARAAVATANPALLLPPIGLPEPVEGRAVSVWPAGEPVDPADPIGAPWAEAGRLLAALHALPVPDGLPPQGAPLRVREIMARPLPDLPASRVILRAYATLPESLEEPGRVHVVHGDFHLGQLVLHGGGWRLIDLDDLGRGDPVWDLARPAALFASGVLPGEVWSRFLHGYLGAGGVDLGTDPWTRLDIPAQALAIQTAARCVSKAVDEGRALDEYETTLIDACDRISRSRTS